MSELSGGAIETFIAQAEARALLGIGEGATDAQRIMYAQLAADDVVQLVRLLRGSRTASSHDDLGIALRNALRSRILAEAKSRGSRDGAGSRDPETVIQQGVKVLSMTVTSTDKRIVVDLRLVVGEVG